jgi:glycosyltransferase involved in cell wall biosynthesis
MSKLKVLVIGNCCLQHFPLIEYGGIESSVENLCTGIRNYYKSDIDLTVIVPKITQKRDITPTYGFRIIDTEYIGCSYSNIHPFYFAEEVKKIIEKSEVKPDIIWGNGDWIAKGLKDLNIPIIATIQDSGPWVDNKYIVHPNVYYRFASKFLFEYVFKDSNINAFVDAVKSRSFWCHTGLDDDEFNLNINKEDYILWVAGLGWGYEGKGLDRFIELAKRLPEENFIAYGSGDDTLAKKLKDISLQVKNFNFMGTLNRGDEHKNVFSKAKLFAMLTRTTEAFGRTNIEAISKGTPVLGSMSGAVPELVNYENVGFCSDDIDELTHFIQYKLPHIDNKVCFEFAKNNYHVKKEIETLLDFTFNTIGKKNKVEI